MRKYKLIRDRVPELVRARGEELNIRIAGPAEMEERLVDKMAEEVAEVMRADTREEMLAELADVLEAAYRLADVCGWTRSDLERAMARKRHTHGGFTQNYLLEIREN